ncbi:hypothetical protein QTP70_005121 [Hemibagrus guttatus]|uniref:Uncharacterized protein n=1 Tax=Hemibagrus guttatus TaxID=175788 RepID=A0AAE0Q5C6_9TELE|nr:hypothetical protein QTP70_005121 [Hemibagrus guttatus]KAK3538544.1 hypothetical protein QTP86_006706 [Hemibagrus guttatus]
MCRTASKCLHNIFKISLSSAVVPTCLKTMTIVPVPKKSTVSCLNDYRPIALTPIVMKCFESHEAHQDIVKNNKSAYREEVQQLTAWCKDNNLSLNVDKTKEMVVENTEWPYSAVH